MHTDNKEKSQYDTVADVLQHLKNLQHLDIEHDWSATFWYIPVFIQQLSIMYYEHLW